MTEERSNTDAMQKKLWCTPTATRELSNVELAWQMRPVQAAAFLIANPEEGWKVCVLCGQCRYWQWGVSPDERSKKQETEEWGYCELAFLNKFEVDNGLFYTGETEGEGLDTHRTFGCVSGKTKERGEDER